jgi:hypothetical protein
VAVSAALATIWPLSLMPVRPEVSIDAEVLGLLGMLLMLATWRSRHWAGLTDQQVTSLLTARLRPLLRDQPATPATKVL